MDSVVSHFVIGSMKRRPFPQDPKCSALRHQPCEKSSFQISRHLGLWGVDTGPSLLPAIPTQDTAPDHEEMPLESVDAIKSLFEGHCRDGDRFLHRNAHSKKARKQCKVQEGSGHARQKSFSKPVFPVERLQAEF